MLLGFVLCVPCVLWCGLLIRTWACYSESGQPRPRTGQAARVRNRRPACERRGAAQHQARCNARKPAMWSLGLLIRTWTCCSEPGQPRPRTGQAARVRNRRPACGTGGPRVKEGVQPYTRLAAMRASSLCGAWAFSSARGPAVPSLGDPAHVRDRRPACGIGGPRAGHVGIQVVVVCGQSAFALVVDGCTTPSVGVAPLLIGCSAP